MASVALDAVLTMPLVHRRVHRKPAVKRRTAVSMERLWEYSHSVLLFEDLAMILDNSSSRAGSLQPDDIRSLKRVVGAAGIIKCEHLGFP